MGRFRETVNNCENGSVTVRWRQSGDKIQRDVGQSTMSDRGNRRRKKLKQLKNRAHMDWREFSLWLSRWFLWSVQTAAPPHPTKL